MKKSKGGFGKVILGILVALGILFIIIMIMPDDEEDAEENVATETAVSTQAAVSTETEAVSHESNEGEAPKGEVRTISVGTSAKSATVMIYMNGSDLESEAGEASADISEMLASGIGENVNVIIQTMGTKDATPSSM